MVLFSSVNKMCLRYFDSINIMFDKKINEF